VPLVEQIDSIEPLYFQKLPSLWIPRNVHALRATADHCAAIKKNQGYPKGPVFIRSKGNCYASLQAFLGVAFRSDWLKTAVQVLHGGMPITHTETREEQWMKCQKARRAKASVD